MEGQGQAGSGQPGPSRRRDRANRILDAASALILRWGYDKTTIDDIARQAAVAKGTIYLHWKTREALFQALVMREALAAIEDLRQHLSDDPEGATLYSVLRHSALALIKRPLLKAIFLRDAEVIGKLAHSMKDSPVYVEKLAGFGAYLEILRAHNVLRTDMTLATQLYALSAIFLGFLLTAPILPEEIAPSDERLAELIGETAHRALASGRPVVPEQIQDSSQAFMQYLDRYVGVVREQVEQKLQ